MKVLIRNGKVVLEDRIARTSVFIEDGRIVRIGDCSPSEAVRIIDAEGRYVAPGVIDIHSHGGAGHDYMEGTKEAFLKATELHMRHGMTSVVPTTVATDKDSTIELLKRVDILKKDPDLPVHILGVHLEGPYLSLKQKGAIPESKIKDPDVQEYTEILNCSGSLLRWTVAPELPGAMELIDALVAHRVQVSIGHSDAEDTDVFQAVRHGATSVTHLYSMSSSIKRINCYRHPGINEAVYLCDELYAEAIADGHHLPDTLLRLIYKGKGADRMILVTDSMSAAGLGNGVFLLGNPKDNHRVLVENNIGFMPDRSSFAGSVATADQLIRTMKNIQIPLHQIMKMASLNPARLLHIDSDTGSVSEGKRADLILFDEDIRVETVLVDGRIRYQSV